MKLKKVNAVLALFTTLAVICHIGYNTYVYITLNYDDTLSTLTRMPLMLFVFMHGICGMCCVFLLGDGTRALDYPGLNKRTLVQRISAALIFPLLIIHLDTTGYLVQNAEDGQMVLFWLLICLQLLFYVVIATHTAISFPKAFVTLGWIESADTEKRLARITYIVMAVLVVIASVAIVKYEISEFIPK